VDLPGIGILYWNVGAACVGRNEPAARCGQAPFRKARAQGFPIRTNGLRPASYARKWLQVGTEGALNTCAGQIERAVMVRGSGRRRGPGAPIGRGFALAVLGTPPRKFLVADP